MKKIFIIFLLSMLSILKASDILEGCGDNEKDALNSLATTISSNIKSEYTKTTTASGKKSYETKAKQSLSISTNLWLKNIESYKKNGKVCRSTTESQVKKDSSKILQEVKNFSLKNLSKKANERKKQVNKVLSKIEFAKYNKLKSDEYKLLNNLEQKLRLIKNKGSIVFIVNAPNIDISISNHKNIKPSQIIELDSGKYSYTINSNCPIDGKFEILSGDKKEIVVKVLPFPVITLSSNKKNAKASINSKETKIDKRETVEECSGKIKWSIEFEGEEKDGTINLYAGMREIISREFVSKEELKIIQEKVTNFAKSKEITISYGNTNSNKEKWNDIDQLSVRYSQNNNIYQYGGTIILGTKDKWRLNNINSLELLASFKLRLTELPNGKPLIIFNTIAILPYIGIDVGWDIGELMSSDNNNIYGVSRWLTGMSFLIHKQIAINVEFEQDFGSKNDNIFLLGAGFSF